MNNLKILKIVRNFIICCTVFSLIGCYTSNKAELLESAVKEFNENKDKIDLIMRFLNKVDSLNPNQSVCFFASPKSKELDFSVLIKSKSGKNYYSYREPNFSMPLDINRVFVDANIMDVWLEKDYFQFRLSESNSLEYDIFLYYEKPGIKKNTNFIKNDSRKINEYWTVVLRKIN